MPCLFKSNSVKSRLCIVDSTGLLWLDGRDINANITVVVAIVTAGLFHCGQR